MQPYLIRPRIQTDESLFSHLVRAAQCNMVSPDRMSHSMGLMHAYQLKPMHHTLLRYDHIIKTYAARFKIPTEVISPKLVRSVMKCGFQSIDWHGLNLQTSDLLLTPRTCPLCIEEQPRIIRDQWFLKIYQICGYHGCNMRHYGTYKIQPNLPFESDELYVCLKNIDLLFSGESINKSDIIATHKTLHEINKIKVRESLIIRSRSNIITTCPPEQLCLLDKPYQ